MVKVSYSEAVIVPLGKLSAYRSKQQTLSLLDDMKMKRSDGIKKKKQRNIQCQKSLTNYRMKQIYDEKCVKGPKCNI